MWRSFRSIQAKVISVIILVLSATVATSIIITIANQRQSFLDETSRNLSVTSSILNNVVRNAMIVGEARIAISTLRDMQGISELQDITIYRRNGIAAFSDDSTIQQVNTYIGRNSFQTSERVPVRTIDNDAFRQVLETNTPVYVESVEDQTVEYYFPILNYKDCRVCHGTDHFIRGVAHIEVSTARVFDEIEMTRNTLTLFFVGTGMALAIIMLLLMRSIVLRPLLKIGSTVAEVGQGNLDTHVDVRSRDELGELAGAINGMIGGLRDKNRLEVENRVIDARNQENRKYLDNINEGLLLLGRDHIISEQYSSFIEELFGTSEIDGRSFSEFIYPNDPPDSEERKDLEQFVDLIFTSITTDMEMISSINPLTDKTLVVRDRQEIVIDATFQRIMAGEEVQNVMVIFVDKTLLVRAEQALENERLRSETEIEQIAAILRTGPDSFLEFAGDADTTLRNLDANIELAGGSDSIAALFRDLHSLKGAARYMELRSFSRTLNEVEEIVAAVRDGNRESGPATTRELTSHLEDLYEGVASIRRINDRFKEFATADSGQQAFARSIRGFFDNVERMVNSLAEERGKKIMLRTSTDLDTLPSLSQLRNPLIHLIRNAVDHGIEEEIERISKGKDGTGIITIGFSREQDNSYRIEVRDDGRGIDFPAVGRRAVELGMIKNANVSQNQLLKVLFHPGFSSRDQADEVSGRGVGLDAVQAVVQSLGGSISVGTKSNVGTRFTLRVPASGDQT